MDFNIKISQFDYDLPNERIAKFPLEKREKSKLLVYRDNQIEDALFDHISEYIPKTSLLVFNDTKVVRARLIFTKPTGALIEIFCLEPIEPANYEESFAAQNNCSWSCIIGNARKWKKGRIAIKHDELELYAEHGTSEGMITFHWNSLHTFGEVLEHFGKIPIPPYLDRDSEESDNQRYQTTYARVEGSVAAPTAGLHFTTEVMERFPNRAQVTLHVGAGTFMPVKAEEISKHHMHTEYFTVELEELRRIAESRGNIIAVGTTTVRTIESMAILGERILENGSPEIEKVVGQWEGYSNTQSTENNPLEILCNYMISNNITRINCSTQIIIMPGYRFRSIKGLITNFHQPRSTLLLLVAAVVGERWHEIYTHALKNQYRFLSYGDSSLLMLP